MTTATQTKTKVTRPAATKPSFEQRLADAVRDASQQITLAASSDEEPEAGYFEAIERLFILAGSKLPTRKL